MMMGRVTRTGGAMMVGVTRRRTYLTEGTMVIGGFERTVASDGEVLKIRSPVDGKVIGEISDGSYLDGEDAVKAARWAFETHEYWRTDRSVRVKTLEAASEWVRKNVEDMAQLETLDCGKPITETRADIDYCADILDYYAQLPYEDELVESNNENTAVRTKHPRGVCVLITPWNYPLMQAVLKIAPCLAAGNTFVLKPSPLASLTCARFVCEGLNQAPEGVCNLVTGGPPSGQLERATEALTKNQDVDLVSFTGSERAGRQILSSNLRPCLLELGGKSALIVCSDAEIERAVELAVRGVIPAAGQICSATSRILVDECIAEKFIDALCAEFSQLELGVDPFSDQCKLGPVISKQRQEFVEKFVVKSAANGDGVLKFRSQPTTQPGYWVRPAVFVDPYFETPLWRDEIFGPVLAVKTFETDQQALDLANSTRFGLANAVVTKDPQRAQFFSDNLRSGVVWLDENQLLWPATPFGGWKASGFGWEGGHAGLLDFQAHKTVIRSPLLSS